jgi:hypothetical protein
MNAFEKFSPWYSHPVAEWCRRTKVNSPYKKLSGFCLYAKGTEIGVWKQPHSVLQLKSANGETWQLKELKFNWAGRIALWLIGFRRAEK